MNNFVSVDSLIESLINILEPVTKTLGPSGKTVFIEKISVTLTKDGITILNNLHTHDKNLNILLQFIKDNINNMNELMGDGTTSTVVLLVDLLKIYLTMDHKKNIIDSLNLYQNFLDKYMNHFIKTIALKDKKFLIDIANIATNNDKKLGHMLVDIIEKIDTNGIIIIEKIANPVENISYELQQGLMINNGPINPLFMVNNGVFQDEIIIENAYVLISSNPLNIINENLEEMFTMIIEEKKSLIVFAPDMGGNFLQQLLKMKNLNYSVMGIKISSNYVSEDVCIITHSTLFNWNHNYSHDKYLGIVEKIIIDHNSTQIFFTNNNNINNHITGLKNQYQQASIENFHHSPIKKILSERIASLTNNMAVIKITGINEAVKDEIKDRLMDGIGAVKMALQGGITLGGGMMELLLHKVLQKKIDENIIHDDMLKPLLHQWNHGLLSVFRQIIENSNENHEIIYGQCENYYKNFKENQFNSIDEGHMMVWNAKINQWVNGWDDGIVNAALIEKHIIKTAFELLYNIINSSFVIVNN